MECEFKSIFRTLFCLFCSLKYLLVVVGCVKFPARFINKLKSKRERESGIKREREKKRERWSLCLPLTFNVLPMSTVPFFIHFFTHLLRRRLSEEPLANRTFKRT